MSTTEKRERQWHAMWVDNPADHSAFSKAYIEQWFRFPVHQDSLAAPSTCSRTNRTPSNVLPEMPADEADNLWSDYGDNQILQAATAYPFGLYHYDVTHNGPWTPPLGVFTWKWPSSSWRSSLGVNNLADEVECRKDGPVVQAALLLSSSLFLALTVCIHMID